MTTYNMEDTSRVGAKAVAYVTAYLKAKPETILIRNVENDTTYQEKDIDLLWTRRTEVGEEEVTIEVKGDTNAHTGNYFFETKSNEEENTPGCFMYSEAAFLYYFFMDKELRGKALHIMPLPVTRAWFLPKKTSFKEKRAQTRTGNGGHYTTVGRLVPIVNVKDAKLGLETEEYDPRFDKR